MRFTKKDTLIIIVSVLLGVPTAFFAENLRDAGLNFIRYNDFVIVGILLLIAAVVFLYRSLIEEKPSSNDKSHRD